MTLITHIVNVDDIASSNGYFPIIGVLEPGEEVCLKMSKYCHLYLWRSHAGQWIINLLGLLGKSSNCKLKTVGV